MLAEREHRGLQVVALGDRLKALLAPLEGVCRYRERRGDDTAAFDVTPRREDALAFAVAAAPGGINLDCAAFTVKELAIEQADVAASLAEAILAGRVRQVRRLGRNGSAMAAKAFVFDAEGRLIFKQRRSTAFAGLAGKGRIERRRFAAYA